MDIKLLKGRDFLALSDFSAEEIITMLDVATDLKRRYIAGEMPNILAKKTLGMIFERTSTRTRVSYEAAMTQLGGHAQFLSPEDLQIARGEDFKDTARVLSRYLDGILIRWYHDVALMLADYSSIPVISGSTGYAHPSQAMADLLTIREKKGRLKDVNVTVAWGFCSRWNKPPTYIHDLLWAGAKIGINITVACPKGYEPISEVLKQARMDAEQTEAKIEIVNDLEEGMKGADVICSKSWVTDPRPLPLGEYPHNNDPEKYRKWIVDAKLLSLAKRDVILMHAMPAYKGEELTEEAFEGPHSVIFDEAANRLHAQKGVLATLLS